MWLVSCCHGNLEQLGLAGAGVATKEDVNVGTELAPACVLEVLPRPSKQLQQDALLDVIVLVDAWSWAG